MENFEIKIAKRKDLNEKTKIELLELHDRTDKTFIDKAYNDYKRLLKGGSNED